MSFDFQLAHACPHVTIEEVALLQSDRKSLFLKQPIASSNNVRITANNEVTIPRTGLLSAARLKSFISGPFRIVKGENLLVIQNRQGSVSINLPIGTRILTTQVVTCLNKALRDANIEILLSSEGGFLVLEDEYQTGPSSFVRVSGSSLSSLGLFNQVAAKGKEVYPSWSLDEKPDVANLSAFGIKSFSSRFPKFSKALKGNPVLKVSYATFREKCYRCIRTGVENDYRISQGGGYQIVQNEDLLYQAGLKSILTIRGSNKFFPSYGSLLTTRIGSKIISETQGLLQGDVSSSLERLQTIQRGQAQYQLVTPRERLESIQGINVFQSDLDPTAFGVQAIIRNASNQPVNLSVLFTVPGSIALKNSLGQNLGAFGGISNLSSVLPG